MVQPSNLAHFSSARTLAAQVFTSTPLPLAASLRDTGHFFQAALAPRLAFFLMHCGHVHMMHWTYLYMKWSVLASISDIVGPEEN